jgi:dihydroxyacid dehydratase/phosphogluconate dehydratase
VTSLLDRVGEGADNLLVLREVRDLLQVEDQKIIRPFSNPIKETGHIQILRGSLAPGGSVGNQSP